MVWYKPGGVKDKISGNIFIKNLAKETKSRDLFTLFQGYGKVFSCRIKGDAIGQCKGYGYVQFESKECAEKAIADANGKELKGLKIEVQQFKARELRNSSISKNNNLFVKNIPKSYTDKELNELFNRFGKIISAVVIKENSSATENKGFGFVCFEKPEDAKTAEEGLKKFELLGQTLYVTRALSKQEHKRQMKEDRMKTFKDCNLYVKELPDEVDDAKLRQAFEEFGKIVSARVMLEKKQDLTSEKYVVKSKNFGFVCFGTVADAKKAIEASHSRQFFGRTLYVGIAESKEERGSKISHNFYMPPMMYPQPAFPGYHRGHRPRYVFSPLYSIGRKT